VAELKSLTLTMELNELKNQINPHFLFNMLNGIKALIRINPEKASVVIITLSEFLRYQLYDNNEEKTSLKAEMNFVTNFLNLEKIRRDNFSVEIGSNTDSQILHTAVLPPNLFTTFVENALKHSATIREASSHIHININIENERLHFNCINSVDPSFEPTNSKSSGLGLTNIQRRLQLLYQDRYQLRIQSGEKEYHVNLTIPL
jgi:two-component system LytT family sensor kinase